MVDNRDRCGGKERTYLILLTAAEVGEYHVISGLHIGKFVELYAPVRMLDAKPVKGRGKYCAA